MKEILYTHWRNRAIEDEPGEAWKFIQGTNNRYLVSSLGRVKSNRIKQGITNTSSIYGEFPLILKQYKTRCGYLNTCLKFTNGKPDGQFKFVHVLVATAFKKNPNLKSDVHHIKNVRTYNPASNLEWNTRKENIQASIRDKGKVYEVVDIVKEENSNQKARLGKQGKCYIYGITDETGKIVYIGKATKPIQRFRQHKTWARHTEFHLQFNLKWLRDILHRGEPQMLILKEVDKKDWVFWEKHYIEYYRNLGHPLHNITSGGYSNSDSHAACMRLHNEKRKRPVLQFDLMGNFLREWVSIREAARGIKMPHQVIRRFLKGGRPTGGGYLWAYKIGDEIPKTIPLVKSEYTTSVSTILKNGESRIWRSISAAAKEFGVNPSCVSQSIIRNHKCRGYKFELVYPNK